MKISIKDLKTNLFFMIIYSTIVVDLFRIVNNHFFEVGNIWTTIFRNMVYIIVFVCMFYVCTYYRKYMTKMIIISFVYVIILLSSYIVNPSIDVLVLDNILMVFSRIIPAYIIASMSENSEELISILKTGKWLLLIYILAFLMWGMSNTRYYYMNVGYNILFPTMILLYDKERNILNKLIAILGMATIVLYCARGTTIVMLLSIISFYGIKYFVNKMNKKKMMFLCIIILCILSGILFLNKIISFLYRLFPSSRTLYYLVSGKIADLSGRDNYYELGISEILDNPLKVRGILGDRVFYGSAFNLDNFEGAYAHNILLELLLQFGLIIGLILCIFILYHVYVAVKSVLKGKNENDICVLCIFIVPSFIICMTTASYLSSTETCLMLGLCTFIRKKYSK